MTAMVGSIADGRNLSRAKWGKRAKMAQKPGRPVGDLTPKTWLAQRLQRVLPHGNISDFGLFRDSNHIDKNGPKSSIHRDLGPFSVCTRLRVFVRACGP